LGPDLATEITPQSPAQTPLINAPAGLPAAEAVASINVINTTVTAKLDAIQNGPRPRFVYKVPTHPWAREDLDTIIRRVSRDARWHAFLFHGRYYWEDILSQYFLPPGASKDTLSVDDNEVSRVRTKVFYIVKNIKADTLKRFDLHIDQALDGHPELAVMDLTNPGLVKDFFVTYGILVHLNTFGFG